MIATAPRPALTLTLAECGSDLCEIAETLRLLGRGMQQTDEMIATTRDDRMDALAKHQLWNLAERREWTRDEVDLTCDDELKHARETARRTAQKALVDLARVVGELTG